MATAAVSGQIMSIAGTTLTEPMDCTVSIKRATIDVTNSNTSGMWKEYIEANGEWTIDGAGNFVSADFDAVIANIGVPAMLPLVLTMGGDTFSGTGFVTSCTINGKTEDKVSISISWQGSAALA